MNNMEYKKMREYTHEEFVEIIKNLSEEELLKLSANYGGYDTRRSFVKAD